MTTATLPGQYHRLKPFREFFQTGVPVLMYHKVGRRPLRARVGGLYVSPADFDRQLAELREAGFTSIPLSEVTAPSRTGAARFAITFDDGFRNVIEHALEPLARHGFKATLFVVEQHIGKVNEWEIRAGDLPEPLADDAEIRAWLAAGHEIGSHTIHHPRLKRLSIRDAWEEIFASKNRLEDRFGVPVRHFCFPYGDHTPVLQSLVAQAGYQTASTIKFGLNTPTTTPYGLHRILVRHPTRGLKALRAGLRRLKKRWTHRQQPAAAS